MPKGKKNRKVVSKKPRQTVDGDKKLSEASEDNGVPSNQGKQTKKITRTVRQKTNLTRKMVNATSGKADQTATTDDNWSDEEGDVSIDSQPRHKAIIDEGDTVLEMEVGDADFLSDGELMADDDEPEVSFNINASRSRSRSR